MRERLSKHITTIIVAFVTAAVASGGAAVAVSAINATKVDGYDANQLVRSAYATHGSIDNFSSTSFKPFATTYLSTKKKGILLITATTWAEWDVDSSASSYTDLITQLRIDGKRVGPTADVEVHDVGSGNDSKNAVNVLAFKVGAGKHTITLVGENSGSGADIYIQRVSLMVLFEPFGHLGKAGVLRPATDAGAQANQR